MACSIDYNFRREYPKTVAILWISSTETNIKQTWGHIDNTNVGYVGAGKELEKLGQADADIGSKELVSAPYPTRLRPLNKLDILYNANKVFFDKVEYYAYDSTLTGSAVQDAAVLADIYASKTTDEIIPQSYFDKGMPVNWVANYFRPEIYINGRNVFDFLQSSNYGKDNKGDNSIGLHLPICIDMQNELKKVNSIELYGQVAQYIRSQNKFQRYPLLAVTWFWVGYSNDTE